MNKYCCFKFCCEDNPLISLQFALKTFGLNVIEDPFYINSDMYGFFVIEGNATEQDIQEMVKIEHEVVEDSDIVEEEEDFIY